MHRIDAPGNLANMFTEGDPTVPVEATDVSADWLNAVQEELVKVITSAGIELKKNDNTQLYQALQKMIPESFPAGTRMLFQQSAAPTGWVKESSPAYNDAALRIVTGDVSTANSLGFSSVFANKNYAVTGTVGNTTLSVAQLATHAHGLGASGGFNYIDASTVRPNVVENAAYNSSPAGSSSTHNHTFSSGTTSINLAVKRADVIICTKL